MPGLEDFQSALAAMDYSSFEDFVLDIIRAARKFTSIARNATVGGDGGRRREIDISALDDTSEAGTPRRTYIEVKKRDVLTIDVVDAIVGKYHDLRVLAGPAHMIVVASGSVSNSARRRADVEGIELWDAVTLAKLAPPELLAKYMGSGAEPVKVSRKATSKHLAFLKSLHSMAPGNEEWSPFQRLTTEIFEYLFCPPLRPPIANLPDADSRNIRDMIVENSVPDGFWWMIRSAYTADYIVVDAKNYGDPIGKRPVLDIAHYLKSYGCGLFGILITRNGAGDAGLSAIREQWINARKMIVVLADADIEEMLTIKASGGKPEEIIRRRIADFRMSL
jgi:hypothetical protein